VARSALLHEEPLDLAVLDITGPDHHDVGDRAVADPLLRTADHIGVAVAARRRLQRNRVGAVIGLGQREGADLLQPGHPRQPGLLLLLRSEHRDRLHGQPGLYADEGGDTAVATAELHVDQSGRERVHRRATVALDAVTDDAQLAELFDQGPGEL